MKSDLSAILDAIATINEKVSIRALDPAAIAKLADKVVWSGKKLRTGLQEVRFGDVRFTPPGGKEGISIDTGSTALDYEIKALVVLMSEVGPSEGDVPYKWQSVVSRTRQLVRFARYCRFRRIESFRALDPLLPTRLRTLLLGFLIDDKDSDGVDQVKNPSLARPVRDAFLMLRQYGLVGRTDFADIVDEVTADRIADHLNNGRLRHPIIPTSVMKRLIAEAAVYVSEAEAQLPSFSEAMRDSHIAFEGEGGSLPNTILYNRHENVAKRLRALIVRYYEDLQRHVYVLVLAFTGMRNSEAQALKTGAYRHKVEEGVDYYSLRTLLTKTDDSAIELDWVANDLAVQAVSVLSHVNELYYARAALALNNSALPYTADQRTEIGDGLAERRLFGVRFTVASAAFLKGSASYKDDATMSFAHYEIPVSEQDIEQLEKMECNYQSVMHGGGRRGRPYSVGDFFRFTAHQFRHTFAWFIVANRLGDLDDIKYQFKHLRQMMTMVYTERGYKSIDEFRTVIEAFAEYANQQSIGEIVTAAEEGTIAGGGGERLARMFQSLNSGGGDMQFSDQEQPHFKNVKDLIAFTTRHSDAIRGLPHGYCTKGPACKIKNAADPSHCLYCDTYFATPKHLPYWRAIYANCMAKLERIRQLPEESRHQFQAFRQSLEDNLFAANKIIARLAPSGAAQQRG
jgi:hypothetical protein